MLTIITDIPFDPQAWPGHGIWASGAGSSFEVVYFSRRFFGAELTSLVRIHVTADQRYKLYLDGEFIGLGPQRGEVEKWYFETFDLDEKIGPGEHVLTAVVWYNRDTPPFAQMSHRPMFLVAAQTPNSEVLSTGSGWRCRRGVGMKTVPVPEESLGIGAGFEMAGSTAGDLVPSREELDRDFEPPVVLARATDGRSDDWCLLFAWRLHPRTIPALEAEVRPLGRMRQASIPAGGLPILIPPHTCCQFLLDHDTLTAGYPMLNVSGGAGSVVRLTYQEALQANPKEVTSKGHRDDIDGRTIMGISDIFHSDGRPEVIFEPLWYRCWRYIRIEIQTAGEGLVINSLTYRTTGYPLELQAEFQADEGFTRLIEPGFRTLKLCSGETFLDCPYYEQLQYIGDTRIMALLTYVLTGDDRLGRQAIDAFDRSRLPDGLTQARYPSRVGQVISTFSLLYIPMLNDFLMWRGDLAFVKDRMFGVESILRAFERFEKSDGLIGKLAKWPFMDWVNTPGWSMGTPPGAAEGSSFMISFLYLYTLQQAETLFRTTGDLPQAEQAAQKAHRLQDRLRQVAFNPTQRLFVDDPSGLHLCQHTNVLALLTDTHQNLIEGESLLENILGDPRVSRTTFYFSFYLFEAMYHVGRGDLIWPALKPWHQMLDVGLTTFAETPEPTRSDCHAWSAHPLYHFFASVLGIRPVTPGCAQISIRPAPNSSGLPQKLGGAFMTPQGKCDVRLETDQSGWKIHSRLPQGISLVS